MLQNGERHLFCDLVVRSHHSDRKEQMDRERERDCSVSEINTVKNCIIISNIS